MKITVFRLKFKMLNKRDIFNKEIKHQKSAVREVNTKQQSFAIIIHLQTNSLNVIFTLENKMQREYHYAKKEGCSYRLRNNCE